MKMAKKTDKTNVMRILDQLKIHYEYNVFDNETQNVFEVSQSLGRAPASVFKTLVTSNRSKEYYVFMVPIEKELDLKKTAKVAGE
ncbi:aminoacyl-tRNA deacylase, partial [Escherichia coli]|nr:aminoacyl-tRNA deacylase [Escherichia coli]